MAESKSSGDGSNKKQGPFSLRKAVMAILCLGLFIGLPIAGWLDEGDEVILVDQTVVLNKAGFTPLQFTLKGKSKVKIEVEILGPFLLDTMLTSRAKYDMLSKELEQGKQSFVWYNKEFSGEHSQNFSVSGELSDGDYVYALSYSALSENAGAKEVKVKVVITVRELRFIGS